MQISLMPQTHTLRIFMNNNLSFANGYISILHGMRMTKKAKAMTYFQTTETPLNLDGKTKLDNLFVLLGIINLGVL